MTLAYQRQGVTFDGGITLAYDEYVVATENDTTASVNGEWIDNRMNDIERIDFVQYVTNRTGTNPTLATKLVGSLDGAIVNDVLDSGGNAITTGAVDISGANSTPTNTPETTSIEGIDAFPTFIRLNTAVGGTNTPGWTGTVSLRVYRKRRPRRYGL